MQAAEPQIADPTTCNQSIDGLEHDIALGVPRSLGMMPAPVADSQRVAKLDIH
jgi:hypothetical protein